MTRERFGGYGREQGADLIAPDNFETKEVPSVSCIELTIAHNLNISQDKKWSTSYLKYHEDMVGMTGTSLLTIWQAIYEAEKPYGPPDVYQCKDYRNEY